MTAVDSQREYWDRVAPTAVFTLPLAVERFRAFVDPAARVLDYGCGYGRQLVGAQADLGYGDLAGVDASAAMVERARNQLPDAADRCLRNAAPHHVPGIASFDAILLSAVLTCIARR